MFKKKLALITIIASIITASSSISYAGGGHVGPEPTRDVSALSISYTTELK